MASSFLTHIAAAHPIATAVVAAVAAFKLAWRISRPFRQVMFVFGIFRTIGRLFR
jgi:hypothetical protein